MADGGLSVPLTYKSNMLGVLAIWREAGGSDVPRVKKKKRKRGWSDAEKRLAERVARTLAVAAVLDRGGGEAHEAPSSAPSQLQPSSADLGTAVGPMRPAGVGRGGGDALDGSVASENHAMLLREISSLLAASVHQLNSPLSAVRTLAKLLLRRLDGDDLTNREIARDILLQAEQLSELIQPIDRLSLALPGADPTRDPAASAAAAATPSVAAAASLTTPVAADAVLGGPLGGTAAGGASPEQQRRVETMLAEALIAPLAKSSLAVPTTPAAPPASPAPPADAPRDAPMGGGRGDEVAGSGGGEDAQQSGVCFIGDILGPLVSLASRIAPERGVDAVFASVDEELPGVLAPEAAVREAVTNLIDNAVKYSQPTPVDADDADGSSDDADGRDGGAPAARRYVAIGCRWAGASSMVEIDVWNTAPSLSADELLAVREWGARGTAAASLGVSGSGYGLAIAEQLIGLLGGQIELANGPMPQWACQQARMRTPPSGVSARILLPRAALRSDPS